MRPLEGTTIRVRVDPTNPGQFFACCGLLELADRLWGEAEGWFEGGAFQLTPSEGEPPDGWNLGSLLKSICEAPLRQVDASDDFASPIELLDPFGIRLDWWKDTRSGGNRLKVWAGSMRGVRIARAMKDALGKPEIRDEYLFDHAMVVYDPIEPDKKVEPFYFDARRGSNARAVDIGFSPDSQGMTSAAYPTVEFLCLVGLQRHRPMPTDKPRVFEYHDWAVPLGVLLASAAACGLVTGVGAHGFRFENAFRTDQKKHKGFLSATRLERSQR